MYVGAVEIYLMLESDSSCLGTKNMPTDECSTTSSLAVRAKILGEPSSRHPAFLHQNKQKDATPQKAASKTVAAEVNG